MLTLHWFSTTTEKRKAGASTAVPMSFQTSSTNARTTRTRHRFLSGESRASLWTGVIETKAFARAALEGALNQIAQAGGGLVEAIPEVTVGREVQGRFLFSATVELFDEYGFHRGRRVGKHAWIVSKVVKAT